jgi:hypothetical protein
MMEHETKNDFLFASDGQTIAPILPVVIKTRQQAYRTAAWIKLMGYGLPDEDVASAYEQVEQAIENT